MRTEYHLRSGNLSFMCSTKYTLPPLTMRVVVYAMCNVRESVKDRGATLYGVSVNHRVRTRTRDLIYGMCFNMPKPD